MHIMKILLVQKIDLLIALLYKSKPLNLVKRYDSGVPRDQRANHPGTNHDQGAHLELGVGHGPGAHLNTQFPAAENNLDNFGDEYSEFQQNKNIKRKSGVVQIPGFGLGKVLKYLI